MGGWHSRLQAACKWSILMEELMCPEASWEFYKGWEIFHIDIELQTLPPDVRDRILDICVDEYTQEIISGEGGDFTQVTHGCSKSQPCSRAHSSDCSRCLGEVSSAKGLCSPEDVNMCQKACLQNSVLTNGFESNDVQENALDGSLLPHKSQESSDTASCSENLGDMSNERSSCPNLREGPRSQDGVRSNESSPNIQEYRDTVCVHRTLQVNAELENCVNQTVHCCRKHENLSSSKSSSDFRQSSSKMGSPRSQSSDCADTHDKRGRRCCCKISTSRKGNRAFQTNSALCPNLSPIAPVSQNPRKSAGVTNTSQRQFWGSGWDWDDILPPPAAARQPIRRQSTPSVRTCDLTTRAPSPAFSKKRTFSWKDQPGWIPNPLDSDSDPEHSEESEMFSDSRASSRQSSSLPTKLFHQRRSIVQLSERRRCNSEPSSGRSAMSTHSSLNENPLNHQNFAKLSSASGPHCKTPPESKWRLMKPLWRKNKPKTVDDTKLSSPAEVEEEDLEKELEWLVSDPDSQPSHDNHSPAEDIDNDPLTQSSPRPSNPTPIGSSAQDSVVTSPVPCQRQPTHLWRQEPELEWLCEPEWNNVELALFWKVLRPHLEFLLQHGDSTHLPDPRVGVSSMDSSDHKLLDRCLLDVQRHIWKGNYHQAVADFRAVTRHFRCCAKSKLVQNGVGNDDVETLRLVFFRKRPSRYRLWI